jgi:hypothetical protein
MQPPARTSLSEGQTNGADRGQTRGEPQAIVVYGCGHLLLVA